MILFSLNQVISSAFYHNSIGLGAPKLIIFVSFPHCKARYLLISHFNSNYPHRTICSVYSCFYFYSQVSIFSRSFNYFQLFVPPLGQVWSGGSASGTPVAELRQPGNLGRLSQPRQALAGGERGAGPHPV